MNDTHIMVQGYVGTSVETRMVAGSDKASFRLGCTPRYFNRTTQEWVDGKTQWYTVNAWRALAVNVRRSVAKGEPVAVSGRLSTSEWVDDSGVPRTSLEIEASFVGHDLSRGHSVFYRTPRPLEEGPADQAAPSAQSDRISSVAGVRPEDVRGLALDALGSASPTPAATGWSAPGVGAEPASNGVSLERRPPEGDGTAQESLASSAA